MATDAFRTSAISSRALILILIGAALGGRVGNVLIALGVLNALGVVAI